MSCDGRRKEFHAYLSATYGEPPAVWDETFAHGVEHPEPAAAAAIACGNLMRAYRQAKILPPMHGSNILPRTKTHGGYAAVWRRIQQQNTLAARCTACGRFMGIGGCMGCAVAQSPVVPLLASVQAVCAALTTVGGRPLLVGGAVRDAVQDGRAPKDMDIEVYGLPAEQVIRTLETFGRVDAVGASFGVLKVRIGDDDLDVSLPRRENKTGAGHRGFQVGIDATMTVAEAAARRDFTINAMAYDPATQQIIDPHGGYQDMQDGVLRHTSDAFAEDPLRVLRGMQFAARMNLRMAPETIGECQRIRDTYADLPVERVWGEWEKWAGAGKQPQAGLRVLRETGWDQHYPMITALQGCPQDPVWHPEGDVWAHTGYVLDAAARIADRDGLDRESRAVLVLAALCHDFGKPATTVMNTQGRWTAPGHDAAGETPTREFLRSVGAPARFDNRVVTLVQEHMTHISGQGPPSDKTVRRLADRLGRGGSSIAELARLVEADHSGRPPLPAQMPARMQDILDHADRLQLTKHAPAALVQGRDLLAWGVAPGPRMGELIRDIQQQYLDGSITDHAQAESYVRSQSA